MKKADAAVPAAHDASDLQSKKVAKGWNHWQMVSAGGAFGNEVHVRRAHPWTN